MKERTNNNNKENNRKEKYLTSLNVLNTIIEKENEKKPKSITC